MPPWVSDTVPVEVRFRLASVKTTRLGVSPETLMALTVKVPVIPASFKVMRVFVPSETKRLLLSPMVMV